METPLVEIRLPDGRVVRQMPDLRWSADDLRLTTSMNRVYWSPRTPSPEDGPAGGATIYRFLRDVPGAKILVDRRPTSAPGVY